MDHPIPTVLADGLAALIELHRDTVAPAEARPRIAAHLARHADWRAELVWQIDPFDHAPHYDLLLRGGLPGTISLSYGPDRAVPWPLRGVQHAKERDLVRVNDTVMEIQQGIGSLDVLWDAPHLVQRLIDICLIGEALQADPVAISDRDLRHAMDGFRRARGLLTVAATQRWLVEHGLSQRELEQHVEEIVKLAVLRQRITAGRVDAFFADHRSDFETLHVAVLRVRDWAMAETVAAAARRDAGALWSVAAAYVMPAGDPAAPADEPVLRVMTAVQAKLPADWRAAIAGVPTGESVALVPAAGGAIVIGVLGRRPARLDGATRKQIEHQLFEAWLAERRAAARIEWYWGDVRRTASAAAPATATPGAAPACDAAGGDSVPDAAAPIRPLRPAWTQGTRA